MKSPSLPQNEAERLAALRDSGLIEADLHPTCDRLTRLAKRLFDVPMAMVNLIGEHTVLVKSAEGASSDTLPRNISFCGHTLLSPSALVVPDTLKDERFADNPMVTDDTPIRFPALRRRQSAPSLCLLPPQHNFALIDKTIEQQALAGSVRTTKRSPSRR
jgi:hypothetical protein